MFHTAVIFPVKYRIFVRKINVVQNHEFRLIYSKIFYKKILVTGKFQEIEGS